ncbi:unnamed protein product [Thelazia callipaeda]|uniref:Transmembrane protein n=1 Tax=Thelazia callipaeda TaxID=103827 RepID=A0A0N5D3U9_THECL|nr:unnamed protein product [Thelazia callipaeda]
MLNSTLPTPPMDELCDWKRDSKNEKMSRCGFRACLNKAAVGQKNVHNHIYKLRGWTRFDWIISLQAMLITIYVLSALAVSAIGYLNPWPMFLLAIFLFIPILPMLFATWYEESFKVFGCMQLLCSFVELFWSSYILLDMKYHDNDWRAYFTMFNVFWQVIKYEY